MILRLTQRGDKSVYGSGSVAGIDVQVRGDNYSCDSSKHACPDFDPKVYLYLTDAASDTLLVEGDVSRSQMGALVFRQGTATGIPFALGAVTLVRQ